jgi:hypothetical protein
MFMPLIGAGNSLKWAGNLTSAYSGLVPSGGITETWGYDRIDNGSDFGNILVPMGTLTPYAALDGSGFNIETLLTGWNGSYLATYLIIKGTGADALTKETVWSTLTINGVTKSAASAVSFDIYSAVRCAWYWDDGDGDPFNLNGTQGQVLPYVITKA